MKEGCQKNKLIYNIIDQNLKALQGIDNIIDKEVKNDLLNFNPDLNEQVRRKLMDVREIFIPRRDEKFEQMVEDFVDVNIVN